MPKWRKTHFAEFAAITGSVEVTRILSAPTWRYPLENTMLIISKLIIQHICGDSQPE